MELQIEEYKELVEDFKSYLNANNYKNRNSYVAFIVEMLKWIEKKGLGSAQEIKRTHLLDYFNYLMGRENRLGGYLGESHLKNHAYGIELFFDMLLQNGEVERGVRVPRKILKGKSSEREVLTVDEMSILYHSTETAIERAIISLAYGCGLRRMEIAQLNMEDFRFTTKELFVRKGKGNKFRTVIMDQIVIRDLQDYIKTERFDLLKRKKTHEKALLINKIGERMSGDSLNNKLKSVIERTEEPSIKDRRITLHSLRHSIATHFHEKGVGLEFIQRFLGHSEIDTSQLYAKKRKEANKYKG